MYKYVTYILYWVSSSIDATFADTLFCSRLSQENSTYFDAASQHIQLNAYN